MSLDFGKGVKAQAIFVVVRDLGVPALLGMRSMARIGMTIVLTKPYRVKMLLPNSENEFVSFPILGEAADIEMAYLTQYESENSAAIEQAEAPRSFTVTLGSDPPQDFGMREEESALSSL